LRCAQADPDTHINKKKTFYFSNWLDNWLTAFNLKHPSLIGSRRDIFANKRLNLIKLFHEGSHLSNYFKYNSALSAISCKLHYTCIWIVTAFLTL
jgi:hypothetical protein